jgi:hypothetical protein
LSCSGRASNLRHTELLASVINASLHAGMPE